MRSYHNNNIIILIESFISVVLSFAVLLSTKIVLGTIKTIEVFINKLNLFNYLNFKNHRSILFSIVTTILILLLTVELQITDPVIYTLVALAVFLLGLPLLMRLGEIALETPTSLSGIKTQIKNSNFEKWFAERMKNPMDVVWIRPLTTLSILIIPVFIGVLIPSLFNTFTVLAYGTAFSIGFNTINAFEHTNSHNRFFKNQNLKGKNKFSFRVIEIYCEYILNFMFARIPNWYRIQHVIIHHVENNGEQDTQSTLPYDRSSFVDFARCAFRFAISGLFSIDIFTYLVKRKRKKAVRELVYGMTFFYSLLLFLSFWNWKFAVTIIVFRFIGQIISTLGFLHEHGMIDISEPNNIYRNSLHFITSENTHASLGDDAHIEHHLHQGSHWSEYIYDYNQNKENYENEKALGFKDGPGGLSKYFYLLWRKDFKNLTSLFIIFGNAEATSSEVANLLMERTRPNLPSMRSKTFNKIDKVLGWSASYLLPWWQENKP
jgi:hypothetical protein